MSKPFIIADEDYERIAYQIITEHHGRFYVDKVGFVKTPGQLRERQIQHDAHVTVDPIRGGLLTYYANNYQWVVSSPRVDKGEFSWVEYINQIH